MRAYIKRLLGQYWTVETVSDGLAALEAITQRLPALVLSDVMMPKLDGFGLLRELRLNPRTQEIPVILLSARAGEEARIEGLEAGADDYLTKPFSARELLARVEATLKLAQLRQDAMQREQVLRQEAETAKQRAETAYDNINQILECMTDAFVAFDRNWCYTYANPAALKLLQKTSEELIGKNVWEEVFPSQVGGTAYRELHRALEEQVSVFWEELSEPIQRWLEVRAYPSPDGVAVYFQDITDRKQAEAALRDSEEQFRTLANAMPQIVWTTNADGEVVYLNQQWFDYSGLTLEQTQDRPQYLQVIYPEDVSQLYQGWADALESGSPYQVEVRIKRASDGVYRWFLVRAVPIKTEQGQVTAWYGTSTDIDDRKHVEMALQESEAIARVRAEELETLMEVVPAAIWLAHDPDCHRVTANRAAYKLMRAELGAPTTATPTDGVYPFKFKLQRNGQDVPVEDLSLQKAGRTGQKTIEEAELVFEDGEVRHMYGRAIPLRNEDGQVRELLERI